jgi:hypothetical protein
METYQDSARAITKAQFAFGLVYKPEGLLDMFNF